MNSFQNPKIQDLMQAADQLARMASDFPSELHKDHPDVQAVLILTRELEESSKQGLEPEKRISIEPRPSKELLIKLVQEERARLGKLEIVEMDAATSFDSAPAEAATYSQGPGWVVTHADYGKWFISREAVAADWKQDYEQANQGKKAPRPNKESVDIWFAEQIGWCEVAHYGVQLERADMAAVEAAWLKKMERDTDYANLHATPKKVEQCPDPKNGFSGTAPSVLVDDQALQALLAAFEQATNHIEEITNAAGPYAGLVGQVVKDSYAACAKANEALMLFRAALKKD